MTLVSFVAAALAWDISPSHAHGTANASIGADPPVMAANSIGNLHPATHPVKVTGAAKVGGLKRNTEVVKHRPGGDPSTSLKVPGRVASRRR